ncbi:hypothetical protein SARC_02370 [Sphaeroforma arctica JP610]|uniref:Thioredoxin domain-containing protein n=1 Tax=Sphaeroforma arctica JP610 TaxID=667725 RepID=A0A0L0G999_9EUKA|nr:hypothetical protein SARC_02370 [Sphaeroforma arctica JP610]KNC85466.1 hypothetical protein SARC_02370 [Sphaeroforma arctica JP610]|eukprot:XP_014159368.1 hypothetical protein SARC_02370 [Sphaeroforma arctica JP610]
MSAKTFDNDAAHGKKAPSLENLEFVQGEALQYSEKLTVVLFWSKISKDEYKTFVQFSKVADKYEKDVQFIGVCLDPSKKDVEGYLSKKGTEMKELEVDNLECSYPVAYDEGKKVRGEFQSLANLLTIGSGMVFVVDKSGTIVWREQFSRMFMPNTKGQLTSQLDLLIAGKKVEYKNGDKEEEEESEEEEMGGDGDFEDPFDF